MRGGGATRRRGEVLARGMPGGGCLAVVPGQDHVFEAAEQADQARDDQGVQGIGQPCGCRLGRQGGAEAGDLVDQRGRFF